VNAKDFDRKFDDGGSVIAELDLSKARRPASPKTDRCVDSNTGTKPGGVKPSRAHALAKRPSPE